MKKLLLFFLIIGLYSCSKKSDYSYVDLSDARILSNPQRLLRFSDKYPFDIAIKDSLAILLFNKDDTCGAVYNLNTRKPVGYFGMVGNGPGEVTGISFVKNIEYALKKDSLYFFDANRGRLMGISLKMQNHFALNDILNSPNPLYKSFEQNITKNRMIGITGRRVPEMFFIYNFITRERQSIECFPEISDIDSIMKSSYYSALLGVNEKNEKIIAGMSCFDMIHIYSFQGERIKTICFSEKCIPPVKDHIFDLSKGYFSMYGIYPTKNFCYIKRREILSVSMENNKYRSTNITSILKLDWNGKLISSYTLPGEDLIRGLYIDEKLNRLYLIQNTIEADNADYWDVVYYDLNSNT